MPVNILVRRSLSSDWEPWCNATVPSDKRASMVLGILRAQFPNYEFKTRPAILMARATTA